MPSHKETYNSNMDINIVYKNSFLKKNLYFLTTRQIPDSIFNTQLKMNSTQYIIELKTTNNCSHAHIIIALLPIAL